MESRRSTRLIQKAQASHAAQTHLQQAKGVPSRQMRAEGSTAKRQKTEHSATVTDKSQTSRPSKRRSKLQNVGALPLELFLEVIQHLGARDLLNMARTTKGIRAIITNPNLTGATWKSAVKEIEPPLPLDKFPKGWDPIQTARLVYDRECQECGAIAGVTTYWAEKTKLCDKCISSHFTFTDHLISLHSTVIAVGNSFYMKGKYYSPKQWMNQFLIEAECFKGNEKSLSKLVGEESQKLMKLKQFRNSMLMWEYSKGYHKKKDVADRRNLRRAEYKAKIAALGFGDELAQMGTHVLENLPSFKGTKPLTEKEWARLEPQVMEHMLAVRKVYSDRAKRNTLNRRIWNLSTARRCYMSHHRDEIVADLGDLASKEPFYSLIFETPIDEEVTLSAFGPMVDAVGAISRSWRDASVNQLLNLLPTSLSKSQSGKGKEVAPELSALDKATALFSCAWCPEILTFPIVLQHPCLTKKHRGQGKNNEQSDNVGSGEESGDEFAVEEDDNPLGPSVTSAGTKWNEGGDQVAFDAEASGLAKTIVRLCGLTTTATLQEMDECDARLECVRCRRAKGKHPRLVMNWRNAIVHELEKHAEDEESEGLKWLLLTSDEDISASKRKEQGQLVGPPKRRVCTECTFVSIERDRCIDVGYHYALDGDETCRNGHDMSHGTHEEYQFGWKFRTMPFKQYRSPVRI